VHVGTLRLTCLATPLLKEFARHNRPNIMSSERLPAPVLKLVRRLPDPVASTIMTLMGRGMVATAFGLPAIG
jgi:hypothetical protein